MTFYFIAGEPSSFVAMANLAHIIKELNPDYIVEAIIPYHAFLAKMDVQKFLDEFDRVWRLPACDFHKNIFRGFLRGKIFKKAVNKIIFADNSIVFAFISMEMSLNLLIKHITERSKSTKIFLLGYNLEQFDAAAHGGKLSSLMVLLDRFYSFTLGCYLMKSYMNANGQLMHREYQKILPFPLLVLSRSMVHGSPGSTFPGIEHLALPYPVVLRHKTYMGKQEKFVIFFGDTTITDFYAQLDREFLINKANQYFNVISRHYAEKKIKVYYKPHPYDRDKIMAGCVSPDIFSEKINAEILFSKYYDNIVATYSICSHSVLFGSTNGIPSYWAYELCFSDEALKKSFRKLVSNNENKLLKSLSSLEQIGSIDENKVKIDTNKIKKAWEAGIQTIIGKV